MEKSPLRRLSRRELFTGVAALFVPKPAGVPEIDIKIQVQEIKSKSTRLSTNWKPTEELALLRGGIWASELIMRERRFATNGQK